MKRFLLIGAAALWSTTLAGGGALASGDDDDKAILATGFTFCEVGNAAVFPVTNVGHESIDVKVQCFAASGDGFSPAKEVTLEPGEAEVEAKLACVNVNIADLSVGGEVVRCTVKGDEEDVAQARGVLHVCGVEVENDETFLVDCGLTEALLTEVEDDDDGKGPGNGNGNGHDHDDDDDGEDHYEPKDEDDDDDGRKVSRRSWWSRR